MTLDERIARIEKILVWLPHAIGNAIGQALREEGLAVTARTHAHERPASGAEAARADGLGADTEASHRTES